MPSDEEIAVEDLFDYLGRMDTLITIGSVVVAAGSGLFVWLRKIRRGRPEGRYARWFLNRYSTYWNPYLDKTELLRLDRTYIPLLFEDSPASPGSLVAATTMIADRDVGNVVVVGVAGSGKTTMLKAYGVSALQGGTSPGSAARDVPFFVPIRLLAAALPRGGLVQYLKTEVLSAGARLTGEEAQVFLAQVLRQRRCVILLDGLDEVTRENYQAVRDEVHRFVSDHSPGLPTANARLVITCRHHNFLRIRDDWLAGPGRSVASQVYGLAPLRDVEIVNYLKRLQDRFARPDGPDYFMAAVRASATLHLHRTPLVLSMSVGLYAGREFFEIPHSIAELYDTMIREMLDRHSFRHEEDRGGEANRFLRDDKLRLLREFGLEMVRDGRGFGPFGRESLIAFARERQLRLRNVPETQVEAFVDEIIDRSGLLTLVSDDRYEFAHRSIHEHLIAAELLHCGDDGVRQLRDRARNREWRQVFVFYTAAADQRVVSPLLTELAAIDVVLAGDCLAGADCLDDDALPILDELAAMLRGGDSDMILPALAALLSATMSPRPTVQEAARNVIYDSLTEITNEAGAVSALGDNPEGVLGIITMLVDRASQAPMSRRLLSRLIAIVPDDPRLVEPLWHLVSNPLVRQPSGDGREADPEFAEFVERLLTLAMDPACFAALQRQPADEPSSVTPELRRHAYPFHNGVDPSSNLVTLLCWADQLKVSPNPEQSNRFLDAKRTDRGAWARLESDRRRRGLSFRVPRISFGPAGRDTAGLAIGIVLTSVTVIVVAIIVADALSPYPVLGLLLRTVVLVAVLAQLALVFPILGLRIQRDSGRRIHILRPNPFIDVYEDPRSRHWLAPNA